MPLIKGGWRGMNWGLKRRAVALCALLLLGTVAALSTALIWLSYRDSMRTMRADAVADAHTISYAAEPGVLLNDRKALQHVIAAALQEKTLCDVTIRDARGRTLAWTYRERCAHPRSRADSQPPIPPKLPRGGVELSQSAGELRVVAPIRPENPGVELDLLEHNADHADLRDAPIGYVALTYSLDEIRAEFINRLLSVVIIGCVVLAIGIAVTVFAVQELLSPLRNLVETTNAIARGDRSKRASEQAVREISELARSFNQMADRLQESYDSIERTVEHRTAELVKASRAKDDFLANMSHEIRTPMTAIVGFADLLYETISCCSVCPAHAACETRGHAREHIETIRRNGDHLLRIINDILDISKIEAGKLELERVRNSTAAIIEEIESLMRARAESNGLSFEVEFLTDVPETIETDPTRLRQILINLVGNAIKFTNEGGVQLRVRLLEAVDKSGAPSPKLRLDVVDTGIGMTPEQLDQAFKPFTQADETMSRRFGGTGLGLTISRHLAHMLGGSITIESEPDKGSTFSLTIATGPLEGVPLINPRAQAPDEQQPSTVSSGAPAAAAGSLDCRVLLAEDGPDNQRLISFVLRKAGAEVVVAENGQVAVEAALAAWQRQQPFDVILMDMQMPVLDGYAATSRLRQEGYRRPIIALTAHAMSTDRQKCLAAGCDEYVAKPIDREHLVQLVAGYARRGSDDSSLTTTSTVQVGDSEQEHAGP